MRQYWFYVFACVGFFFLVSCMWRKPLPPLFLSGMHSSKTLPRSEYAHAFHTTLYNVLKSKLVSVTTKDQAAYTLFVEVESLDISDRLFSDSGIAYSKEIKISVSCTVYDKKGTILWKQQFSETELLHKPQSQRWYHHFFASAYQELCYATACRVYTKLVAFFLDKQK